MDKNKKIALGCVLVIGGLIAYNKGDNQINIKANDDISTKTLGAIVAGLGGYVLYRAIKLN